MGLPAILAGLFRCSKAPDRESHHKVSEITMLSLSCSHMDYSYCYYFALTLGERGWLFDAECFINNHEEKTVFSGRVVKSEDVEKLFDILERNRSIAYAETYKKPKKFFIIMDETIYSFCLIFSDGSQCTAASAGTAIRELEDYFYLLAETSD